MITTLLAVVILHWAVLVTPGANVLVVSQLALVDGFDRTSYQVTRDVAFVAIAKALPIE